MYQIQLMFINIYVHTVTGAETKKNVSSKYYHAYRLMVGRGQENVILRCRELCQRFMVDTSVELR